MSAIPFPSYALLAAAQRGDPTAADAFVRGLADLVWTACRHVTHEVSEAEEAFGEVMAALRANRFSRLKGYDGRANLKVYVTLVVRDLLSERTMKLLAIDAERGWRAFEAFFGSDIRRMMTRMLPGANNEQNREDGYQSVCEAIVKNDYQRLRAYSGRGSPSGFVLHMIENLAVDFVRTIVPRRRLPAAVERLCNLDQSVFRLIYWDGVNADSTVLARRLLRSGEVSPSAEEITEAIDRIRRALPPTFHVEPRGNAQTVSLSTTEDGAVVSGAEDFAVRTPEEQVIDSQTGNLLDEAINALRSALPRLAAGEQLYLQLALTGQPAREIARMVGCPVEDIHKLAQKVKRRLREEIGEDETIKKWRLSV